jgi:DNA-binding NarL/FixJ family response regulator
MEMTADTIRVLLCDDHRIVRAGINAVLDSTKDIQVVGEASNGREAVDLVEELDPDVLVMDVSMSDMDGISATRLLSSKNVRSRILIFTMHSEDGLLVELLKAGATGYLTKAATSRELLDAIRSVAHGQLYVQPHAARVLAEAAICNTRQASEIRKFDNLTEREQQVLRLVAGGFSAPEIGARLFISPKTVDSYRKRINEKLGLSTRSNYVSFALSLGLMDQAVHKDSDYLLSSSP